jgi:hypothetical protein
MPSRFNKLALDPERIESMHRAYEKACAALGLAVLPDKINEVLVTKIVELGSTENYSADVLCEGVGVFPRQQPG